MRDASAPAGPAATETCAGLARIDAMLRVHWVDAGFERCVGQRASALIARALAQVLAGAAPDADASAAPPAHWPDKLSLALAADDGFAAIAFDAPDAAGTMRCWTLGGAPRESDGGRVVALHDLEPLRRAERDRAALAERLALVQQFGRIGVWERDPQTLAGYWDAQMFELWQLPVQAQAPNYAQVAERMAPGDRRDGAFVATLAHPGDHEARVRIRLSDGSLRHMHSQWRVSHDADGSPRRVLGIMRDDTAVYRLAQSFQETSAQLAWAVDLGHIAMWRSELATRRVTLNDECCVLLGLKFNPSPMRYAQALRCVHPQDRRQERDAMRRAIAAPGTVVDTQARYQRADGQWRHALTRRVAQADAQGRLLALIGMALDITEQRQASERLRNATERAALAARGAGIGTWEVDPTREHAIWDAQMFRLRGLEPAAQAPPFAALSAMIHPDDREALSQAMSDRFDKALPAEYEFRVVWPDGSVHWLASRSTPLPDEQGGGFRRVGVNWDITAAKAAELALRDKALALRESRAKSQFLARMSHELRTPLNAVLGFTQLLQSEAQASGQPATIGKLEHIRVAGDHLLALINDALDLSSLESGEVRLALQPIGLSAVLRQAMAMVAELAARQGVALRMQDVHGAVLADGTRLTQVLINLLSNAIKYSHRGGEVRVEARRAGPRLRLSIRDSGLGLSEAQRAHLFEPFNRLGADRLGIAGTGIGLAIVKALVLAMGGTIDVASEPGQGSCFTVELPAAQLRADEPAPMTSAVPAAAPAPRPGRLLYIEDNAVNVLLVEELLRRLPGITLSCAGLGAQGLAMAVSERPDLILLDMQLPDFNGHTVFERLRSQPATAAIPCIALSANAMPEDIARALADGFADYWTKPIDTQAFVAALGAWFQA